MCSSIPSLTSVENTSTGTIMDIAILMIMITTMRTIMGIATVMAIVIQKKKCRLTSISFSVYGHSS